MNNRTRTPLEIMEELTNLKMLYENSNEAEHYTKVCFQIQTAVGIFENELEFLKTNFRENTSLKCIMERKLNLIEAIQKGKESLR